MDLRDKSDEKSGCDTVLKHYDRCRGHPTSNSGCGVVGIVIVRYCGFKVKS